MQGGLFIVVVAVFLTVPIRASTDFATEEAQEFMNKSDALVRKWSNKMAISNWNYESNITAANQKEQEQTTEGFSKALEGIKKEMKRFKWKKFEQQHPQLYRWFKFLELSSTELQHRIKSPNYQEYRKKEVNDGKEESKERILQKLGTIFNEARVCSYKKKEKCNMAFSPDINNVMSKSRNYTELAYYWSEYRKKTGGKMKKLYEMLVEVSNKEAREMGFHDFGDLYMAQYETPAFYKQVKSALLKILPLYKQIHAYVRKKLKSIYKTEKVDWEKGPIPAHILGDMFGQRWVSIYDILNPYKKTSASLGNVTESLLKKKMKPIDLFIIAERFFTSLGLKPMTPRFWHNSIFTKPNDREIVCHASAHDFSDGKDFRIRMCTGISQDSLVTVHHEMGHIEYFQHYQDLPQLFQASPNPGFHEAIGDTISLSALTPEYLQDIGLIEKTNAHETDKKADISYLMSVALHYMVGIPYAFLLDDWRYKVYNGTIKPVDYNKEYWELRLKYQGLCPPVERKKTDFDIGAKYHIPFNVEYMRYFISNILQFQIHKALCKEKQHKGPLFKCNIYKSKKAGKLLGRILSAGRSKEARKIMKVITKGCSENYVDPEALLEYFEPLYKWLKKENKNEYIGWKSNNPMQCPEN